jgi:hypothetical protein
VPKRDRFIPPVDMTGQGPLPFCSRHLLGFRSVLQISPRWATSPLTSAILLRTRPSSPCPPNTRNLPITRGSSLGSSRRNRMTNGLSPWSLTSRARGYPSWSEPTLSPPPTDVPRRLYNGERGPARRRLSRVPPSGAISQPLLLKRSCSPLCVGPVRRDGTTSGRGGSLAPAFFALDNENPPTTLPVGSVFIRHGRGLCTMVYGAPIRVQPLESGSDR